MSQTPHVRLAGGRQDGRLVALDPRAAARLQDTGEDTVVYRDQQQVRVVHDLTDDEAVLRADERTHRDGQDNYASSDTAPTADDNHDSST